MRTAPEADARAGAAEPYTPDAGRSAARSCGARVVPVSVPPERQAALRQAETWLQEPRVRRPAVRPPQSPALRRPGLRPGARSLQLGLAQLRPGQLGQKRPRVARRPGPPARLVRLRPRAEEARPQQEAEPAGAAGPQS